MQCSRKIFDKHFIVYAKLRYFFECLHTTHSLLLNHQLPYQFTDDIISSLMVGTGNVEHLTVPEQNRIRSTEFFEEVQNSAQIFVKSKKKKRKVITSEEVQNSAQISPNVFQSAWTSALSVLLRSDIQISEILSEPKYSGKKIFSYRILWDSNHTGFGVPHCPSLIDGITKCYFTALLLLVWFHIFCLKSPILFELTQQTYHYHYFTFV